MPSNPARCACGTIGFSDIPADAGSLKCELCGIELYSQLVGGRTRFGMGWPPVFEGDALDLLGSPWTPRQERVVLVHSVKDFAELWELPVSGRDPRLEHLADIPVHAVPTLVPPGKYLVFPPLATGSKFTDAGPIDAPADG